MESSGFVCSLVTKRAARDLSAIIITTITNALAFTTMVIITKLLTNQAVKKRKNGVRRNDSWIVFTFSERPRIIQHSMVPMKWSHHNHRLTSSSPHYSQFSSSLEPSGYSSVEGQTETSSIKSRSVFNEREIIDCLHGRQSSEVNSKERHTGGFFFISDEAILERRGVDALNYLLFLRHLIYFLAVVSFLCTFIILPVNLIGDGAKNSGLFARSTIENVQPGSQYLWAHIAVGNLFLPIGFILLVHNYAASKSDQERFASRTLYVRKKASKNSRFPRQDIACLIKEITYNELIIEGIQFVYDVRSMKAYKNEFIKNFSAEKFCLEYLEEYNESFELRPYMFGQWLGLLGLSVFFPKTYGLTYFRRKKWEAVKKLIRAYSRALNHAQGAFFITFRTEEMAQSVRKKIANQSLFGGCLCRMCGNSSHHHEAASWKASFAPDPMDINWDALVVNKRGMWLRSLWVNMLLFIIFFFCTTPSFILPYISSGVNYILTLEQRFTELQQQYENELEPISFIAQYVKPLILLLVASMLPNFVYFFSSLVPNPLKSEQTHAVMWRTYCFTILMIIIIPSLGQSSFHEVVRSIVAKQTFQWYCLFHSYEYSFFVIYVVQSAFIGNGLEFMKISRIATFFFVRLFQTSSEAEYDHKIDQIDLEFNLGLKYSRILFMLTMILLYSVSCPAITVCGFVFIVIKYYIDRHSLYYSCYPSQVSCKTYRRITVMFFSTIFMMQFHLFTIVYTKSAPTNALAFDLILLLISFILLPFVTYLVQSPKPTEAKNEHDESEGEQTSSKDEKVSSPNWCCCAYLPDIIKQMGRSKLKPRAFNDDSDITSLDTLISS